MQRFAAAARIGPDRLDPDKLSRLADCIAEQIEQIEEVPPMLGGLLYCGDVNAGLLWHRR